MTIRKGDIIVSGNGFYAGANKDLSNLSEEGLLKLTTPVATNNTLGIVKPDGTTITITEDGTISSVGGFSGDYNDLTNKPTIPSAYTLPTASTSTLGGVKVDGTTITIANGIISAGSTNIYIKESYVNGKSGYNIYSNGYCEQWGYSSGGGMTTDPIRVNLLKSYKNTDYNIEVSNTFKSDGVGGFPGPVIGPSPSSSYFNACCFSADGGSIPFYWSTKGYV